VLREMNSKCPVPSRMQGDIGVMPTVPASNITEVIAEEPYPSYDPSTELADSIVAAEAEARHTAAHPPAVDSIKLEL
jgi:hypothetical protein